jgi:hypothetical protein
MFNNIVILAGMVSRVLSKIAACIHLHYVPRLVPSRYLNFNFIGTNIYIYRSVPKVDACKGKKEGEGKNNDWEITDSIFQLWRKDYFNIHHRAFLADKLPCLHEECQYNLSCYDRDGLDHHLIQDNP